MFEVWNRNYISPFIPTLPGPYIHCHETSRGLHLLRRRPRVATMLTLPNPTHETASHKEKGIWSYFFLNCLSWKFRFFFMHTVWNCSVFIYIAWWCYFLMKLMFYFAGSIYARLYQFPHLWGYPIPVAHSFVGVVQDYLLYLRGWERQIILIVSFLNIYNTSLQSKSSFSFFVNYFSYFAYLIKISSAAISLIINICATT